MAMNLPGRATHLLTFPHLWPLCGQVGGALLTEDRKRVDCRKCRRMMARAK